ncbi:MAG: hypothetical protein JST35_12220 [Armatimonadetes bacterium]|nr:hypothetical protein [Armatimonadota bacterium]
MRKLDFGVSGVVSIRLGALGYLSHLDRIMKRLDEAEIDSYSPSIRLISIDTVSPMDHEDSSNMKAGLYYVRVYQDFDLAGLSFKVLPFQYENGEATFLYHLVTMLQEGTRKAAPRLKKKLPDFDSERFIQDVDEAIKAYLATVTLSENVPIPREYRLVYDQLIKEGKDPADHGLGFLNQPPFEPMA